MDNELPAVYHCYRPKARKEHRCYECRGVIRKGEVYRSHRGVWDGAGATFKVCPQCEDLRAEMDASLESGEDTTAFGQVYESVFESKDPKWITRWMSNCRAREARIPDWQLRVEQELKAFVLTLTQSTK